MKVKEFTLVIEKNIPEQKQMVEGELYISRHYKTSSHLCACGCKFLTVLPFTKADDWNFAFTPTKYDGFLVSVNPSIKNPCGAHYYIHENKTVDA